MIGLGVLLNRMRADMKLKKLFLIALCLGVLSACVHISDTIHDMPIRSSKSKILKTLGQPFKIQRKGGRDYWIYKFVIDGRHYTQALIIKDGMLYRKGKLKPYSLKSF